MRSKHKADCALVMATNGQLFHTRFTIRAVAGQRSSPDLCFATKFIKIYDP